MQHIQISTSNIEFSNAYINEYHIHSHFSPYDFQIYTFLFKAPRMLKNNLGRFFLLSIFVL